MAEKILLVDDESNILDGYRRSLRGEFEMEIALGGQQALTCIAENGPYAVVISDMRMPGIDGIQLLSRIKGVSPDTVRVMLTGNADMETAVNAINEGSIFLQVLSEVLSLVNPAAFSRAERARRYIHHIVTFMKLGNPWQYEIAAMLSQLGCVTLAAETTDAVYRGQALSPNDQAQYDAHPSVAYALLSKIPRLEPIAWMIKQQNQPVAKSGESEMADMRLGAEILRLILAYEKAIHQGSSRTEAAHLLARQNTNFSPEFFRALVTLDPNAEEGELRKCGIQELAPGMIIQREVRSSEGTLLVSKGQEVTPTVIAKLKNFHARSAIGGDVTVSVPKTTIAFVKGAS